jgi:hypothetical protein
MNGEELSICEKIQLAPAQIMVSSICTIFATNQKAFIFQAGTSLFVWRTKTKDRAVTRIYNVGSVCEELNK